MFASRIPWALIAVLGLTAVGTADNILAEQSWVPDVAKSIAFYILPPAMLVNIVVLMPYLKQRLSIVVPRRTSNLVLAVAVGTSAFLLVAWGAVYYQVQFLGTTSISFTGLIIKHAVGVISAGVFGVVGIRIVRWYLRTGNIVTLGWGVGFLLTIPFFVFLLLPDYLPSFNPNSLSNPFWVVRTAEVVIASFPAYIMGIPYYGRRWLKWAVIMFAFDLTVIIAGVTTVLNIALSDFSTSVLIFGVAADSFIGILVYSRLVRKTPNPVAKEYYWGVGYGLTMFGAAGCSADAGLSNLYPLSGFAALSMTIFTACFCFATFTSAAGYFSISEEIKREIRQDKGFLASIGEAQSAISTEQEITKFYDRFTGLARESGAVEASSVTKDEILSYATAVQKMQNSHHDSHGD